MPKTTIKKGKRKKKTGSIGKNFPAVLSKALVKNWYTAVSEFVYNAYDENAEEVFIEVGEGLESLVIRDDGLGMNKKGLISFFRLGDSEKLRHPYSSKPKLRKRIGKFGIAKVLLQYLGSSFKIESIKDGFLYHIEEGVSADRKVKGKKFKVKKRTPNGTTITVCDLKFKVGNKPWELDIKKLYKRLQWDIPNKLDFNVYVNGELVKQRGVIEYARTYTIHEKIGRNTLTGRIWWSGNRTHKKELEGVRIYVNEKAVGGPEMFDLSVIDKRLPKKTEGEIHADFLEDIVTLDREDFQEDPRLEEVKKIIIRVLRSIKEDLGAGRGRRDFFKHKQNFGHVKTALALAEEELNRKLAGEKHLLLELTSQEVSGPVSWLDRDNGTIYLNPQNKMFSLVKMGKHSTDRKVSEIYLKRAFLIAAAHALIKNGDKQEEIDRLIEANAAELFKDYSGIGNIISRFIEGNFLTPLRELYLNKYRLYDNTELAEMTGRSSIVIRLLHNSRALKGTRDHLFSKNNILAALNPLEGYISCIETVDKKYQGTGMDIVKDGVKIEYDNPEPTSLDVVLAEKKEERENLEKLGVINIGSEKHPLHFVPLERINEFKLYVKQKEMYNER